MGRPDLQVIMHVWHLMDLHLELVEYIECVNLIKSVWTLFHSYSLLSFVFLIYHVKRMHSTVVV